MLFNQMFFQTQAVQMCLKAGAQICGVQVCYDFVLIWFDLDNLVICLPLMRMIVVFCPVYRSQLTFYCLTVNWSCFLSF